MRTAAVSRAKVIESTGPEAALSTLCTVAEAAPAVTALTSTGPSEVSGAVGGTRATTRVSRTVAANEDSGTAPTATARPAAAVAGTPARVSASARVGTVTSTTGRDVARATEPSRDTMVMDPAASARRTSALTVWVPRIRAMPSAVAEASTAWRAASSTSPVTVMGAPAPRIDEVPALESRSARAPEPRPVAVRVSSVVASTLRPVAPVTVASVREASVVVSASSTARPRPLPPSARTELRSVAEAPTARPPARFMVPRATMAWVRLRSRPSAKAPGPWATRVRAAIWAGVSPAAARLAEVGRPAVAARSSVPVAAESTVTRAASTSAPSTQASVSRSIRPAAATAAPAREALFRASTESCPRVCTAPPSIPARAELVAESSAASTSRPEPSVVADIARASDDTWRVTAPSARRRESRTRTAADDEATSAPSARAWASSTMAPPARVASVTVTEAVAPELRSSEALRFRSPAPVSTTAPGVTVIERARMVSSAPESVRRISPAMRMVAPGALMTMVTRPAVGTA